jgi:RNA polymerase sigma-70 factor (ECF subfamily)
MNLPSPQNTDRAFLEKENLLAIHAALAQLPEPFRGTILRSLQGDTLEEIALKEGVSAGTVKSRLFRARERMKIILQECFGEKI